MNYDRNQQFGLSIIGYMYTIIPADSLDVYGTSLVAYRKGRSTNPAGAAELLV